MNLRPDNNITAELLNKYFNGELSEKEKNALEKLALDDPFLQNAMEGFEISPESLKKHIERQNTLGKKFNRIYLITGLLLTAALSAILVILHKNPENQNVISNPPENQTENQTTEVEIFPVSIDTLTPAPIEEQIQVSEVVKNKKEIQKTISYNDIPGETPIVIEEELTITEEFEIIPENVNLSVVELVPATHLHDLFVVDYRRIKREHTDIYYTKYVFSGTPAEFESEHTQNTSEMLETRVDMPYWDYLRKSMEVFAKGNYKNALNRYIIILEQYPEDMNAFFYGGLCYYNLGNFNKALEFFDQVLIIDLNAFKEESTWYKAKTLIKLSRKNEAKLLLDEIIATGGFYAADAIALKKKL